MFKRISFVIVKIVLACTLVVVLLPTIVLLSIYGNVNFELKREDDV